jgi:hypothetical protein
MSEPTTPQGPNGPKNRPPAPRDQTASGPASDPTATTPPVSQTVPMPVTPAAGSVPPAGPLPAGGPLPPAGPLPPKGPGLLRQATSTTGGLIAVVIAACLTALLVMGLAGAGLFVGARLLGRHANVVRVQQAERGQLSPGQRKKLQGQGPMGDPQMPGFPGGPGKGNGLGPLMRGAAGLGGVQHGEFTVQGTDGQPTTMTLQRGTVTAASATSVTVKSGDGFTATYAVDATTRGAKAGLVKGDTALVVADKAGAKAVLIRATRTP